MTVCETWFYFSMVGLLDMIGVVLRVYRAKIKLKWLVIALVLIICILAIRTATRGTDWSGKYKLASSDIQSSPDDYTAYNDIAFALINQGNNADAVKYAQRSVDIFPYATNYSNLGLSQMNLYQYSQAQRSFQRGLEYGQDVELYKNLAGLSLVYGSPGNDQHTLTEATNLFPQDGRLWFYQAIFSAEHNHNPDAKVALARAIQYGFPVPQFIYHNIMGDKSFSFQTTIGNITIP